MHVFIIEESELQTTWRQACPIRHGQGVSLSSDLRKPFIDPAGVAADISKKNRGNIHLQRVSHKML